MAAIVVPPALVLVCFPEIVVSLWSSDRALAATVGPILRVLALGYLANALMNIPYMLQLAYGWTSLAIRLNSVAVLLFVPLVIWSVPRYGALGAAGVWLALNLGYLLLVATLMHRQVLRGARGRWYRDAVVCPLVAGGALGLLSSMAAPNPGSRLASAAFLVGAGFLILIGTSLAIPSVRRWSIAASTSVQHALWYRSADN